MGRKAPEVCSSCPTPLPTSQHTAMHQTEAWKTRAGSGRWPGVRQRGWGTSPCPWHSLGLPCALASVPPPILDWGPVESGMPLGGWEMCVNAWGWECVCMYVGGGVG